MATHFTPIIVGAAADASVINAPLTELDNAILNETTARAGGDTSLQTAYEAADDQLEASYEAADEALRQAINDVGMTSTSGLQAETAARTAADAELSTSHIAGDQALQSQIDSLSATTSTTGGTAVTTLTRNAGAAVIASIGGDGTTTTVTCAGAHGYQDGDYVTVAGTASYNGDSAAIDVLSTTQFTYPSAITAATETSGTVATKRLFVADSSAYVPAMHVTVTSDTGELHTSTVAGIPASGQITLTTPIPASWTLAERASVNGVVSTSLPEVVLSRSEMPGTGLSLPTLLRYGLGYRCNPDAFSGATDAQKIATAFAAADSGNGELLLTRDYTIGIGEQLVFTGSRVKIAAQRGARFLVGGTGAANTDARPFVVRNATDIDLADLTLVCSRTTPTVGLAIENSSRIRVQGMRIQSFPMYGIAISQDTSNTINTNVTFTAATKTIASAPGTFAAYAAGTIFVVQGSASNNGMHTVATKSGDGSSVTVLETVVSEGAGARVYFQIATACDDILIESNTIEDAQIIGIEGFPKVLSQNISVVTNTLKRCGIGPGNVVSSGGGSIKAGTNTRNALISHNHIHGGGTGIAAGMWEITEIDHNVIQDCYGYGIAITASVHRLYGNGYAAVPSFTLLKIKDNVLAFTPSFPATGNGAINVNGLKTDAGPIDIDGNTTNGWFNGITIGNSLQAVRLIRIRNNTLVDGQVITVQLSMNATSAVGSNVLTGAVATAGGYPAGWIAGALIENPAVLPAGTTITNILSSGATLTISAPATAGGTSVSITNVSADLDTRADIANGSNLLTNVQNVDGMTVGDLIVGSGIPVGATITAIGSSTAQVTLSANATAAGLATFTSGLPAGMTVSENDMTATMPFVTGTTTSGNATVSGVSAADSAKLRTGMYVRGTGITAGTTIVSIGSGGFVMSANATASGTGSIMAIGPRKLTPWATDVRVINNVLRNFSAYALDIKGGGLVVGNRFLGCDPEGIINRGAIFVRDPVAYSISGNVYDNGQYGALEYGIYNTNSTLIREENNLAVQSTIRSVLTPTAGFGSYAQNAGMTHAGRRMMWAAAPPLAADGTFAVGSIVWNINAASAGNAGWYCTIAGSPGTWKTFGTIA